MRASTVGSNIKDMKKWPVVSENCILQNNFIEKNKNVAGQFGGLLSSWVNLPHGPRRRNLRSIWKEFYYYYFVLFEELKNPKVNQNREGIKKNNM